MITHEIEVSKEGEVGKLPYSCRWDDYCRLLLVFTFDGTILLFRVPELQLDLEAINRNQTIPLEE